MKLFHLFQEAARMALEIPPSQVRTEGMHTPLPKSGPSACGVVGPTLCQHLLPHPQGFRGFRQLPAARDQAHSSVRGVGGDSCSHPRRTVS